MTIQSVCRHSQEPTRYFSWRKFNDASARLADSRSHRFTPAKENGPQLYRRRRWHNAPVSTDSRCSRAQNNSRKRGGASSICCYCSFTTLEIWPLNAPNSAATDRSLRLLEIGVRRTIKPKCLRLGGAAGCLYRKQRRETRPSPACYVCPPEIKCANNSARLETQKCL